MNSSIRIICGIFLATTLLSNSSLSKFDLNAPEHPSPEREFHFNYTGEVFLENGIMPLAGQLSKDGESMYFTSQNSKGGKQVYRMDRDALGDDFKTPVKLAGEINDGKYDIIMPSVSADESMMVFVHSANGMQSGNDLYLATKDAATGEYSNIRPLSEVNDQNLSDSYPWLSPDGLHLYFTKQHGSDITFLVATRNSTADKFGAAEKLGVQLPHVSNNMSCFLSNDEKEFFALSGNKIYYATRPTKTARFNVPVEIANSDNNGYISGITMTNDAHELFVYNSVGFRNTQILRFVNNGKVTTPTFNEPEKK